MSRILLIEDDTGAQLLYRSRLGDLGHEVVVSQTGAKGLMEARSAPFDLFLVDIGLGSGVDGFEVCRRLRAMPEIHGVPVVLISSSVKTQEDLHRGYEAGCQAFLVKGELTLLEDVVRAMLRIRSLQNDLALQNRLLDERNRRLETERARAEGLEEALAGGTSKARVPLRPDGVMLVDEDGVVRRSDRGASDLFGQSIEGKHLARLAPESRLEAIVRNAHSEPRESIRFEVPERLGRAARALSASVFPFVPTADQTEPALRLVLLHDASRQRLGDGQAASADAAFRGPEWGALVEAARAVYRPQAVLGTSAAARALRAHLSVAARGEGPVLVSGPAGSGKEFVGRVLHFTGGRPGPFVTLACGAFGPRELELELFGSAKDAGEIPERAGALQVAHGGTLFLRDLERLPQTLQERLLEVVVRGTHRRPGSPAAEPVDVRLVGATRCDPARALEQGQLLPELARRFASETLVLTRLAERPEDVEPLARHFLARHSHFEGARFTPEALWALGQHLWPAYVRELELAVLGACLVARAPEIGLPELPQPLAELARSLREQGRAPRPGARSKTNGFEREFEALLSSLDSTVSLLETYEKGALMHALRLTDGDKLAAARLLKLGKSTFYRKIKHYGIA